MLAAISAGNSACVSCHVNVTEGGGHLELHASSVATSPLPGTPAACGECHDANAVTEHGKTTSSSSAASCDACHPSPRDTLMTWGKGCVQGGCHAAGTSQEMHGSIEASHAPLAANASCTAAGCHATGDLASLHSEATTQVAGVTRTSCAVCHASGIPATRDCRTCHVTEGVDYHTNATSHIAPVSDYESCGHCHHGWGSNPLRGQDVKRHAGGCATCHNSTIDLAGKTAHCASCHTTEGAGTAPAAYHRETVVIHSPVDPVSVACADCHETTNVRVLHTKLACQTCHVTYSCTECHSLHNGSPGTSLLSAMSCTARCHTTAGTDYHRSQDASHTYGAMEPGCISAGCHPSNNVVAVHASYVGTGSANPGYADGCHLCHDNTDPTRVPATATADCSSCHDTAGIHDTSGDDATHTATPFTAAAQGTGADGAVEAEGRECSVCHTGTLRTAHATVSTSGGSITCTECHGDATLGSTGVVTAGWPTRRCTECHDAGTASTHEGYATAHAASTTRGCAGSGAACHDYTDLAKLHDKSQSGGAPTKQSCANTGCHVTKDLRPSAVGADSCGQGSGGGCHADKTTTNHGYDPAKHASTETCFLECHSNELKPVHDAAVPAVACTGCHPTRVADVAPWDGTCTACHPTAVADHAPASHVGTDTGYSDANFFGNGCSALDGHTDMLYCHDISSLAALHAKMPDRGCSVCHASPNTPKRECLDCHQVGESVEYTMPGAFVSSVATFYPSSDASITPGWSWTTNPTGQPRYAVVNTPYPPADTTRFVTVTTSTAGGMLFGFAPLSIPANARITDVRIYAKAKAANSTYPRTMRGLLQIGGSDYPSSNQSATLPYGSWLGGTGAGQSFSTAPTRVDYTAGTALRRDDLAEPEDRGGLDRRRAERYRSREQPGSVRCPAHRIDGCEQRQHRPGVPQGLLLRDGRPHRLADRRDRHVSPQQRQVHPRSGGRGREAVRGVARRTAGTTLSTSRTATTSAIAATTVPRRSAPRRGRGCGTASPPTRMNPKRRPGPSRSNPSPFQPILLRSPSRRTTGWGPTGAGYVEISTDGGTEWTQLTGTVGGTSLASITGTATDWTPASYDLSAYAGQSASLRFRYVGGSSRNLGWAFDSLVDRGQRRRRCSATTRRRSSRTGRTSTGPARWARSRTSGSDAMRRVLSRICGAAAMRPRGRSQREDRPRDPPRRRQVPTSYALWSRTLSARTTGMLATTATPGSSPSETAASAANRYTIRWTR